jgi:hypothetical protein
MALRTMCQDQDKACGKLGASGAEQLKRVLADLRIVDSVFEIPAVELRESKRGDRVRITFYAGCWMTVAPNEKSVPVSDQGRVDWRNVRRVQILNIEVNNA